MEEPPPVAESCVILGAIGLSFLKFQENSPWISYIRKWSSVIEEKMLWIRISWKGNWIHTRPVRRIASRERLLEVYSD